MMTNKSFNSGVEKEEMAEKLDSNALPDPLVMRITVIGMRRRNSSKGQMATNHKGLCRYRGSC